MQFQISLQDRDVQAADQNLRAFEQPIEVAAPGAIFLMRSSRIARHPDQRCERSVAANQLRFRGASHLPATLDAIRVVEFEPPSDALRDAAFAGH